MSLKSSLKSKKNPYLHSPLNYTGGKYKLLSQIIPLMPNNINTFVDLFMGGGNVITNIDAKNKIGNDYVEQLISLYRTIQNVPIQDIINHIEGKVNQYNLSKTNKEGYLTFRKDYNDNQEKYPLDLFTLICYSFNNQIRFNSKGEYNMPFGKDRSYFTDSIKNNLITFKERLENTTLLNEDFRYVMQLPLTSGDYVYCDPPYLITTASYNENGGWTANDERDLLSILDKLNKKNIYFGLSNVLSNKGKNNDILLEWINKNNYTVHHLNHTYGNCNYHAKDKSTSSTDEVFITNY